MKIIIIAALTAKGVIGKDGKMPWHIPEELAHFKRETSGNFVLMGRKTFETLGKPLSGRINLIVSKKKKFEAENLFTFDNLSSAFDYAKNKGCGKLFVIGGESIFNLSVDLADELILSFIKKEYAGDKFFPLEKLKDFEIYKIEEHKSFTIKRYGRK